MYKVKEISAPLSMQFELTYECNNYCTFCYNVWKEPEVAEQKKKKILTFNQICNIIDQIKEAGVFNISFTGGEPTIHPRFLDILKYTNKQNLHPSFVTNGNIINEKFAKQIKETGVNHCQVSMHASTAKLHEKLTQVKGSFGKVTKGIKCLVDQGIGININMTVTQINMHDIFSTAKLAKKLGARSFSITRFVYSGLGTTHQKDLGIKREDQKYLITAIAKVEEELDLSIRILTPIPLCAVNNPEKIAGRMSKCDGGITWCVVSPSGEVRTCTNANIEAGNLKELLLKEVWKKSKPFQRCRELKHVPEECRNCKAFFMCGGGCRACAYNYSKGNLTAFDPCSDPNRVSDLNNKISKIQSYVIKRKMRDTKKQIIDNVEQASDLLIPYINGFLHVRQEEFGLLASTGYAFAIVNENGLDILRECDGNKTIAQIINKFDNIFDQPKDEIKKGVIDFLKKVTLMELIQWKAVE